MGRFVKGDVLVTIFPFSDLSNSKKRPALALTDSYGDDIILCQITSRNIYDDMVIALESGDFADGSLSKPSNIRPNKLFTADCKIIAYRAGAVKTDKFDEVIDKIIEMFRH